MHEKILQRWNSTSLRTKITGVTVLMLTFGLIVSGIGTMTVLRTYLLNQVKVQLDAAYNDPSSFLGPSASAETFTPNDVKLAPSDYYVALLDGDGAVIVSNWDSKKDSAHPQVSGLDLHQTNELAGSIFTVPGSEGKFDWLAVGMIVPFKSDGTSGTLVIGQSLQETENTTATYLSIFLAFGIGVVVLGAMLTRLIVTSTFAPLRAVEKTAAAIADGDFSQRMSEVTPNTEVGRLNSSLNTMLSRIDGALGDRARTIDQMRRFVGDASHELRTPLVSVRGYAELYRMGALQTPEDVAQAMERIEKEAIRMGTLVEDLLELARLDETRPMALAPVDLIPIAMDAAMDARASSPGRAVTVLTKRATDPVITFPAAIGAPFSNDTVPLERLKPGSQRPGPSTTDNNSTGAISFAGATFARLLSRTGTERGRTSRAARNAAHATGEVAPLEVTAAKVPDSSLPELTETSAVLPLVMADENKIRQVLANLIGNALRFTDDDSPIELAVEVDETANLVYLDVIDHGEGIPAQIREKIFQRFWRADSSRARETGGSGLGLAIVSSIVHAHKGTVEALETPGGGATFRISLPLLREDHTGKVSPNPVRVNTTR